MSFPYLRHPIALSALFLTALNDHYFKYQFHNFLTGKISDFTGLFYFPFFLYALFDFLKCPKAKHEVIDLKIFVWLIFATDIVFLIFKFTAARILLMQWFPMQITKDPTDLITLTVSVPAYLFAKKFKKLI